MTALTARLRARTVPNWVKNADNALTHMDGHKPDPDCAAAAAELDRLTAAAGAAADLAITWENRARRLGWCDADMPATRYSRQPAAWPFQLGDDDCRPASGFPFDITPQP